MGDYSYVERAKVLAGESPPLALVYATLALVERIEQVGILVEKRVYPPMSVHLDGAKEQALENVAAEARAYLDGSPYSDRRDEEEARDHLELALETLQEAEEQEAKE